MTHLPSNTAIRSSVVPLDVSMLGPFLWLIGTNGCSVCTMQHEQHLIKLRSQERENLRLVRRAILQERKQSFGHAESECRRHTILHCPHILLVEPLCFIVTRVAHFLLFFETCALVERVVQPAVALAHFRSRTDNLYSVHNVLTSR